MEVIRTFMAIELPSETRQKLVEVQNRLRSSAPPHAVGWVAAQNFHLTLHFLGNLPVEKTEPLSRALTERVVGLAPFSLKLLELGCFPNLRRPRVIWVGVGGDTEALMALHGSLGQLLNDLIGFTPEGRPYAPHLTLGRVSKGIPSRRLEQLAQALTGQISQVGQVGEVPVNGVSLMKSELTRHGPIYTQLAHQPLV